MGYNKNFIYCRVGTNFIYKTINLYAKLFHILLLKIQLAIVCKPCNKKTKRSIVKSIDKNEIAKLLFTRRLECDGT